MRRTFLIFCLMGAAGLVGAGAQTVTVAGSDLLQAAVSEPLQRYATQNGKDWKVDLSGTVPAMAALREGNAQLAIIAIPLSDVLPDSKEYTVIKFCFQVDYILVNQANPLKEMDRNQLVGVFSTGDENITRWEQLHLAGEWTTRPIIALSTSTDDGVVVELFKNTLFGHNEFKPTVQIMKTPTELVKTVVDNPNSLALSGFDPGNVTVISLSSEQGSAAPGVPKVPFSPTEDNVYSGDYPLRLPFYLVFKPADKARVSELVKLLLGNEFAGHLKAQHYMPVTETFRNHSALELDK